MSWMAFVLIGVLMTAAVNYRCRRMLWLCLAYAVIYGIFMWLYSVQTLTPSWYLECAIGEIAVMMSARAISTPASLTLIRLSIGALFFHLATYVTYLSGSTIFYEHYSMMIKFVEGSQLAALIVFSPPITDALKPKVKEVATWTRMLLHT